MLTSSVGPDPGEVNVASVDGAKHALADRPALDHTIASKAEVSVFYAERGRAVYFTVAQGDCGPDATALSLGLPSTPSSWKSIRVGVAASMCALRSTEWFRQCFRACQEFSPDPVIADPISVDDSSADGSESGNEGADPSAADDVELETDHKTVRWAISCVSGVPLGDRSVPAPMLHTYIKRMSAE